MNPLEVTLLLLCAAALAALVWLYFAPLELAGELRRGAPEPAYPRREGAPGAPEPAYPRRERGEGFAGELRLRLGATSLVAVPEEGRSWQLELKLCGLGLARWKTSPGEERAPAADEEAAPPWRDAGRTLARVRRHWDLGDLLRFVLGHRHLLSIGPLEGRVEFCLEDPALTGELFGYASAALQLSPAFVRVELVPLWIFENGCWGRLRGRVRARLFALLAAVAIYLVTHYRRDRSADVADPRFGGGAAAT